MNKQECDIVKDLAVNYAERLLSDNSKNFVEKHLLECEDCKKYYNDMNSDFLENKTDNIKDAIEINYLKKIKNHISILKNVLIIILICIITIIAVFSARYYNTQNIVEKTYEKVENMKDANNYKLIKKTIYKDFTNEENSFEVTFSYYYKDGKYKIQYGNSSTRYLEDNSYNKICVYDDLKQIEYYTQNFIEEEKGDIMNMFSEILEYKNSYTNFEILGLKLREDAFEGIDCYVIKKGTDKSYKEIWINKSTFEIIRIVSEEKSKHYTDEIYTFLEGETTNADVDSSILNTEKYQDYNKLNIKNNATEEIKIYYELKNIDEKF